MAKSHWLSNAQPQPETPSEMNITLEKLLAPITEKLKYLLKKAEDFQTYLLYSVSCFFCGKFWMNETWQVSIFRYCISAPYTAAHIPHNLYKKMRWNLDILEGYAARNQTLRTEYYFLCFRDTGDETTVKMQKLWSIGRWVPIDPDSEHSSDVLSWVLCHQPTGDYQQLLTIGFEEPSHTLATDLLVQMLHAQSSGLLNRESSCWVGPGEQVQ
ncbi:PREDICTED: UPF0575 protein C19orf67 homolog [Thamnophis sirtalis]|uniref:UPF0575 protein C19orf67 homolog n=1 Tax=Thamnophis sirtalis TaxID=35019 RepID=A0A6I9YJJ1_9SAUR|nr:PREDICTED: UPF0575 protein C19orf67 homolog [Thamnophis sirtalis]